MVLRWDRSHKPYTLWLGDAAEVGEEGTMPTILDVAAKAGVSRSTVSRVLTGSSKVDVETKRRVMAAMAELNYRPNPVARHLRRQRTGLIALLVPDLANPFFGILATGMEAVAVAHGYHIVLCNTAEDPVRELDYLRLLETNQVDGMVMAAMRNDPEAVKAFRRWGPVVLACEYLDDDSLPAVGIDNTEAAMKATAFLIAKGHTGIAFINGPGRTPLSRDRLDGYRNTLHRHGLEIRSEFIQTGDFSHDSGFACTAKLLAMTPRPSAIFAANDEMAVGAIHAAQTRGLRVPQDIAVVGMDDLPVARMVRPTLTTVTQPIAQIGTVAMQVLMSELAGNGVDNRRWVLDSELTVRDST